MNNILKKLRNKKQQVILNVIMAFILVAITVTACGRSASTNFSVSDSIDGDYEMADTAPAAGADMYKVAAKSSNAAFIANEEAADFSDAATETAVDSSGSDTTAEITPENIPEDRKLIRTVNLSFETTEFDKFIDDLQHKTTELGGYVESSDINGNAETSSNRYAYFTLRIPKPQLDTFLDFAECGANLTRKYENTQDITLRYHDTESRKKALKEEYDRLLELMAQAESVDAIISIEQRLSDIRYELDNYESDLRTYDNQVDYSTVTVDVSETSIYTPTQKTTFWGRVSSNLEQNIEELIEAVTDFLVWFISSLPIFIFLAIVCGVIWLIIRTLIKSHGKRAAARAKKMAAVNTVETKNENISSDDETKHKDAPLKTTNSNTSKEKDTALNSENNTSDK